ncbi:MAG: NADH-quinone oxidoreductase subunit M [Betaproteobacteria bacterium]|nr:NADH-quinone oxidoreductase subunit M [Betaproteobacteria bacterium]
MSVHAPTHATPGAPVASSLKGGQNWYLLGIGLIVLSGLFCIATAAPSSGATKWLSLSIWVPIIAGVIVMFIGDDKNRVLARQIALLGAIAGWLVTIPLYAGFASGSAEMQFVEFMPWIERFQINYHVGIDGISLIFILLNAFVTVLVVIAGWEVIESRVSQYMSAFLIMSGLMNGVFSALDAALFYVFFEATLIPMYLVIGIWGGPNRVYAAFKFFLFTLLGSLLFLVALIYLYTESGGSFSILDFHTLPIPGAAQIWLFFALFAAFSVKVPMWPVHTWLPDAHVEAPTGGSAVLAAIMLKLGAYGFIRFSLPILPDASRELAGFMITLSLIAVVYIGLVALVQKDMKKLIAYSSISHMGFVTLGFFIFNAAGIEGALVQMISHGFVSAAMFLCVGVMYDRMHSRLISDYGGVVNTMPKFAAFMMLFAMANCGLPATSGFVGEFMVILGAVQYNFWIGFAAASTLIFGAAYTLWMYKRVIFGDMANDHVKALTDINGREFLVMSLLAIPVLWVGLYPAIITDVMHASVAELLKHVAQSKFN